MVSVSVLSCAVSHALTMLRTNRASSSPAAIQNRFAIVSFTLWMSIDSWPLARLRAIFTIATIIAASTKPPTMAVTPNRTSFHRVDPR